MAEPVCYIRGEFVPFSEARISPDDLGMLRGFAVYEGLTAFGGEPFHFHDHWVRLESSAKALDLEIPLSEAEALAAMRRVVAKNVGKGRGTIRVILSGGEADGGIEHVRGREMFIIMAEPAVPLPEKWYERGAPIITYEHQRFLPEYKTINYITAVMLQPKRKAAEAVEILFVSKGEVLECGGSNIFIVKDGGVATPKENILAGITRKVVINLAGDATYPLEERRVSVEELTTADEIFITSSFKDIVPIVKIDDRAEGGGAVGPVTKDLMRRFAAHVKSDSWRA